MEKIKAPPAGDWGKGAARDLDRRVRSRRESDDQIAEADARREADQVAERRWRRMARTIRIAAAGLAAVLVLILIAIFEGIRRVEDHHRESTSLALRQVHAAERAAESAELQEIRARVKGAQFLGLEKRLGELENGR